MSRSPITAQIDRLCRAFWRQDRGVVALVFTLMVPVVFGAAAATTDYAMIINRRAQLQTAADMAALAAGRELILSNSSDETVENAARTIATSHLGSAVGGALVVGAVVNNRTGVEVTITENLKFMMGKAFGWPSVDVKVLAAAKRVGKGGNICALALDPSLDATIRLDHSAKITATRCAIYSDSKHPEGIKAFQNAVASADRICTAGGYVGKGGVNFTPTPTTDCPQMGDPLKDRAPPSIPTVCKETDKVVSGTSETLWPGRYCGGLRVTNGGTVQLMAGEYIIDNGKLIVGPDSTLQGEYVGFYFYGEGAILDFDPTSTISLSAPKSDSMAGILFFEDRDATLLRKFRVLSNNARKLLGTIYLPRGLLYIGANAPVSDEAAYTVILARQLQLEAGPNLVLNTNYGATDVPLPKGVEAIGNDLVLAR